MFPEATVDVFYIVASTNGLKYTDSLMQKIAQECRISLKMHRFNFLENIRRESIDYENGIETRVYGPVQHCLWPDVSCEKEPIIKEFQEKIQKEGKNYEKKMYRVSPWEADAGIFTSVENRRIVEKELLLKGIEIVSNFSEKKGMYPLGYNLWPSFGFGSFCASILNISNSCPLVLWSDYNWYPLLPRRINGMGDTVVLEEEYEVEYCNGDQYNMCPDCGEYFGTETDGGNGFCIDCAGNH